jgi:hypothetical protein
VLHVLRVFCAADASGGNPLHGRVETLRPPAGDVAVRFDGELTFIAGKPE